MNPHHVQMSRCDRSTTQWCMKSILLSLFLGATLVSCPIQGTAQRRTVVVLHQPACGLSSHGTFRATVGLPFPTRSSPLHTDPSASGEDGRIEVARELGAHVSWSVVDVRGRTVSRGEATISEAGGRVITIDRLAEAAAGLYFITLRSSDVGRYHVLRYLKR
jgi:hypothetical protein